MVLVEAGRLFVRTLRDLEHRTGATDEYEVLMSAALLRKLLVDGGRLMDQVNRSHRLRLRFRISGVSPYEDTLLAMNPEFWSIEDALDPEGPLAYAPFEATLDQFLERRIMRFNGQWITVRDVIDQLANVEGAVHSSNAKDDRERTLLAAGQLYSRDGLPGVVAQVRLIGRITVRGLTPLSNAVADAGTATWAAVDPNGSIELRDGGGEERAESDGGPG